MRKISNRRSRRARLLLDNAELDLKPFMNLFVVLIPFLLVCAQFAKIALIEIKLPEHGAVTTVKPKKAEEKLNLSIVVTDYRLQIAAREGLMRGIEYREYHKYASTSDKHEFTVEVDPEKSNKPVFSPSDRKRMTPQERMEILLYACKRTKQRQKGAPVMKALYNRFEEALTDERGRILIRVRPGQTVFTLPHRKQEVVRNTALYRVSPLSAYDMVAADLLMIKARFEGQGIPDENDIIIAAEDEISYDKIIQIIDVCRATGFPNVSIAKIQG